MMIYLGPQPENTRLFITNIGISAVLFTFSLLQHYFCMLFQRYICWCVTLGTAQETELRQHYSKLFVHPK